MRDETLFRRRERVSDPEDDAAAYIPIPQLSQETGISDLTQYSWWKQARVEGIAVPADGENTEKWSSED